MATRRAPHRPKSPAPADDQVRVVVRGDQAQLKRYLAELLVRLLERAERR